MIRGVPNISIPNLSYSMPQGTKMSLPVDSASLIYSHFEHVSGIPVQNGTQGVSISKLNLLDVLIEQMNKVKGGSPVSVMAEEISGGSLDKLIEGYNNQIRQAKAASTIMPYIPSPGTPSGALFNLIV